MKKLQYVHVINDLEHFFFGVAINFELIYYIYFIKKEEFKLEKLIWQILIDSL